MSFILNKKKTSLIVFSSFKELKQVVRKGRKSEEETLAIGSRVLNSALSDPSVVKLLICLIATLKKKLKVFLALFALDYAKKKLHVQKKEHG